MGKRPKGEKPGGEKTKRGKDLAPNIWHMSGFCVYVHAMSFSNVYFRIVEHAMHCYLGPGSEFLNFQFCSNK